MTIGAVDIGRTKIVVGMVDDTGRVLSRAECPNDADDYRSCLDLIASKLRETARNVPAQKSPA